MSPSTDRRLLASTGSMAVATLASRITGFFKQTLLLTVLGGAVASSFTVASVIPNMISELVLGYVLTAIVVPVLVRAEREDPDRGAAFIRRLFTAACVLLGVAALFATAAAPLLTTHVFLSDDGQVNTALTTALSYLLLPAILCYGLTALLTAILNTREVFKPGAWAPVLNNLVVLATLGIYVLIPGEISLDPVRMGDPKLLTLGLGVLLGVVVQVLSLVPAIRREGVDLRPLWGIDRRLRRFGGMAVAIVLYVLISQIGWIVATRISSHVDAAGPAIYQQAWNLLQLPYGVFGVTVLTAIMPRLSRHAAADDTPAVVNDLSVATRWTLLALVPVAAFLTVAGPIIGTALFGYGNFGTADAHRLGEAVRWSAFALIPYALVLIHLRVFYAREEAWTPTWIVLGITTVKIGLSALAPLLAGGPGQVVVLLGSANALAYVAGAIIGGLLLHRSLGNLRLGSIARTGWAVLGAALAGVAVVAVADRLTGLHRLADVWGGPGALVAVVIDGLLMLIVTLTVLRLVGVPELVAVTRAVSRRLRRGSAGPVRSPRRPEEYDPLMDAETMVMPVIRVGPLYDARTETVPYAVPKGSVRGTAWQQYANEGVRVSDDATADISGGDAHADPQRGGIFTETKNNIPAGPRRVAATPPPIRDDGTADHAASPAPAGPSTGSNPAVRGPSLIPGASVAGGRYRLLAPHGGARGLMFWQALDTKLDREVALTFVDAEQNALTVTGEDGPQAILSRTLRLGRISSPGLARVLDVVRGSSGGIVVAEWTPGRSLREMADTRPSPVGAGRAIAALAAAAEQTHRAGSALSIDHPDRVRISVNGDAVLAFPATLADADPQSDVRGLGAMLYALITARWPLGGTPAGVSGTAAAAGTRTVGGLRPADRNPDGSPVEPRSIRPEVPFEISAIAVRALQPNRGVRTAATVQHVLEQASVVNQKTDLIPALRLGQRSPGATGHSLTDPEQVAAERARSKRTLMMIGGLGSLAVLVLALLGWWVANFLAGGGSQPLSEQNLGLTSTNAASADGSGGAEAGAAPVQPSGVTVYSPQGTADNAGAAGQVLDNNPGTTWRTDNYLQPLPALKPGLGLMLTLPAPTKLSEVWINSPSAGTGVEIRSAASENPAFDQTQVIGNATLTSGVTKIPINSDQPVSQVLIWINKLASNGGGQNQSIIADVGITAAP